MDDAPEARLGLPAALTDHAGYLAVVMGQVSQARFEAAMEPLDLRPVHFDYLATLAENGDVSQRELARLLELDAARIVGLTDTLEERGLVTRSADPQDRRRNLLTLTPAGRRLFVRASRVAAGVEEGLLARLSPEDRVTLRALLRTALGMPPPG